MFVGSEQVKQLAMSRGKVPEEKIVLAGLPIRHDFALQAEKMGDRHSEAGKAYQKKVRTDLELPFVDRNTILVMGGGEGVGSLSNIVDALYVELVTQGIDALILVVCGRNEKLKKKLTERNWREVVKRWQAAKERTGLSSRILSADVCGTGLSTPGCIEGGTVTGSIRRMLSHGSLTIGSAISAPVSQSSDDAAEKTALEETKEKEAKAAKAALEISTLASTSIEEPVVGHTAGKVDVVGLGFVTNMADYMVAADVLVSKAGPGTISEAAALSLPVMLTSFLPGQEEGNVDYVIDGGFGAYCSESDPIGVAEEVCMWLTDSIKLKELSAAAKAKGSPYAARDIAQAIGDSATHWKELNEEKSHSGENPA